QAIVSALRPAILDRQVPALDIAGFPQSIVKRAQTVAKQVGPFGAEHPDHRHCRLLCARRERPHSRCTTNQRDELAPSHLLLQAQEKLSRLMKNTSSTRSSLLSILCGPSKLKSLPSPFTVVADASTRLG